MNPKTMGERLKYCREHVNESLEAVGELAGVHKTTVMRWENGETKRISLDVIETLASHFGVSSAWLAGKDVPMNPLNLVSPNITDDVVTFPVLGCIAAGYEEIAVEDWNGAVVEVPAAYLKGRDKKDFFVLEVRGSSMYPLYQEKDIVLILKQNYIDHNGDVGAVIYDRECATLKRIDVSDDMVRLSPINPEYQPKELRGADLEMYHILGVPRMLIREIN